MSRCFACELCQLSARDLPSLSTLARNLHRFARQRSESVRSDDGDGCDGGGDSMMMVALAVL
eukprot:1010790-Rhodomonas_salina.2